MVSGGRWCATKGEALELEHRTHHPLMPLNTIGDRALTLIACDQPTNGLQCSTTSADK